MKQLATIHACTLLAALAAAGAAHAQTNLERARTGWRKMNAL